MTWLTLWLKKIILVVLLGAFLDLILPNTSLQRYVKMVMGLILLLTIISPVFSLFNMSQDDLALRLDQYQQELDKPVDEEWKRITDKLLGQQNEQVTAYVKEQVSASVRQSVKQAYGMDVQHIEIVMNQDNPEQPVLQRIELVVADSVADDETAVRPIQPIQPIEIRVDPVSAPDVAPPDQEVNAQQPNPLHAQIAGDIAARWGLASNQVVVKDESPGGEKR